MPVHLSPTNIDTRPAETNQHDAEALSPAPAQGTNALDQELATLRVLVIRLDRTPGSAAGPPHRTTPTQT
jgi:hypothetical protein